MPIEIGENLAMTLICLGILWATVRYRNRK